MLDLPDGIINLLADAGKNKQLFSTEWLLYAEKRVPELYQEVKDGKREVTVDGKVVKTEAIKSGIYSLSRSKIQKIIERNY